MKNKHILFSTVSCMIIFSFDVGAQCVMSQDCAALGYTKTEADCPNNGVKCPFGNKWYCPCIPTCPSGTCEPGTVAYYEGGEDGCGKKCRSCVKFRADQRGDLKYQQLTCREGMSTTVNQSVDCIYEYHCSTLGGLSVGLPLRFTYNVLLSCYCQYYDDTCRAFCPDKDYLTEKQRRNCAFTGHFY